LWAEIVFGLYNGDYVFGKRENMFHLEKQINRADEIFSFDKFYKKKASG